ncbi:Protein LEG1 like [Dissostichus eleginoides]|uniref:Protein LEG1 like n=1 Tax=Dissostichus eleginoides TaxID=100907 RepID=A0AAD9BSR5_DISEL|nr:Protein LEG1 like [Dissostichus eleginoides]
MLRPAVLGLLLACAVSLSSSAVILENGMPVLWVHTAGQLSDLPVQNDILNPDPWHFLHRMSLYRLMIAATDPFMGSMGTNATDSPIWGLPLQLGWMLTSGRLADPTGVSTCGLQTGDTMCISTESWWSCVNYFVSALPFLSAAQQGFMGDGLQVQMQVPEGVLDYCTTYADCLSRYPDAMGKWDAFFQGLKAATDSPLPENEKKDSLLGLYWEAQMASTHASAACNARWETGDYVERCHVFSDHKRKRQRDARAALTGSHIRYNHFPFNRHRNDYELLRYREKSIRMNKS